MLNVDSRIGECGGRVVAGPRGEPDVADAVSVAAWLAAITAGGPQIIVDLAGLEFIDSSGVAALARGRKPAWQATLITARSHRPHTLGTGPAGQNPPSSRRFARRSKEPR